MSDWKSISKQYTYQLLTNLGLFKKRKGLHKNDTVVLGHRQTLPLYLTISEKSFPLLFQFFFLYRLYKELDFILIFVFSKI